MDDQPHSIYHPPEALMAAYVLGKCSLAEQAEIDEHCFSCEQCRTQLSILMRVCAVGENEDERRQLEHLFPLGMEAIAQARQDEHVVFARLRAQLPTGTAQTQPVATSFVARLSAYLSQPKYWVPALAMLLLFVGGGAYYWTSSQSPVRNGLLAMQRGYRNSRPLEARITGVSSYQPYERKRGNTSDTEGVDRDQVNYALAELTRAVAQQPSVEARHALGRLHLLLGNYDQAEEQLTKALGMANANAKLYSDLATLYYERSKLHETYPMLDKAAKNYESALAIDGSLAEAWFNLALCHEQMALFSKARDEWEHYLKLDANSAWANEAKARLLKLQPRASQPTGADQGMQRDVQAALSAGDDNALRQVISQNFVAVKQVVAENLIDEYLKSALAGDTTTASAQLSSLKKLGSLIEEIKSDRYLIDAAEFASRASPQVMQGVQDVRSMLRRADTEFARSSLDAAFKHYSQARQDAERIGDQCHAEVAAYKLTRYYNLRPNSDSLAQIGLRVLHDTERLRHRQLQAQVLCALASGYLGSLQTAQALDFSNKGAEIAQKLGDVDTSITGLRFAGAAYARSGDYEHATEKNFEAIKILRTNQITPLRAAQAYHQFAETLFRAENYQHALYYQQEGLRFAERLQNDMYMAGAIGRVGLTSWKLGKLNEADQRLREALTRSEAIKDETARALLQVDLYTALGDFLLPQSRKDPLKAEGAVTAYQNALRTIAHTNNRVYLSNIHQGLAVAYQAQGKLAEAEAALRVSINLAERDRRQISDAYGRSVFLASRQNVYRAMTDFQFTTKQDPAQAFNYAEIAKSRDLLDALSGHGRLVSDAGQHSLQLSGAAQALPLRRVQQSLPAQVQMLAFSVTDERLLMWVVERDRLVPASVDISAAELSKKATEYLKGMREQRDLVVLNQQGKELYQLLIAPVAAALDPKKTLCIVPDSALAQVPFTALVAPQAERYLAEDFVITVNPSASVFVETLALARSKRVSSQNLQQESFFGLSNPLFDYKRFQRLPSLPSADEEVGQAKSFYVRALTVNRDQATKQALVSQMAKHEIVHVATHVMINAESPLSSAIVLASGPNEGNEPSVASTEGELQAHEIYRLKLSRTRLVVLSGCRSAVGRYGQGEALGALAQGFFTAGVPTVVASLWEVDDESTASLMQKFHQRHRVEQESFTEALRQAQRALIHGTAIKYRHPYYWAAFIISGAEPNVNKIQ